MTLPQLHVISLGAGVQSTTMALMAAHGEITPMPDCAIFADTQDEPEAVYDHLRWLTSPNTLPFPVHIVSRGKLSERLRMGDDEARCPAYVGAGGLSKRQCTTNFKIRPIRRKIRELLNVGPRGYIAPGRVKSWIGISLDEIERMKPSGVQYIVNRHPLLELRMRRYDCALWLQRHDYPLPPKSACIQCGFRDNAQWRAMAPNDFQKACVFDSWLREPEQIRRFRGELYLHPSRVPLAEADLRSDDEKVGQGTFINECEGMCGV